jgi:hypothetical protein
VAQFDVKLNSRNAAKNAKGLVNVRLAKAFAFFAALPAAKVL